MEEKMLKDYSVKEFFEFLNNKKSEVKLIISNLEKKKKIFDICCGTEEVYNPNNNTKEPYFYCYKNKIKNALNNKKGREEIILVFKNIFGYKFFDYTEEKIKELEKENVFTRNKLREIFKDVVGIKNGKVINLPKTWYELIDLLDLVIQNIDDKKVSEKDRKSYLSSLVVIENLIAANYKDLMSLIYLEERLLEKLEDVFQKYRSRKIINIDNKDIEFIELLNHGIMEEKIDENGHKHYTEIGFGDLTIKFIELYNNEINRVSNEKNKEIETNRAFKKLKNKTLEELEYSDFPSLPMSKEAYVALRNKICKYVCSKKNDKKDLNHLIPLLDMYYYDYVYSDYNLNELESNFNI